MSVQVKGSGTIGGLDEGLNVVGVTTITGASTSTLLIKASNNNGTPKLLLQDGLSRNNFIAVEGADNLVFATDEGNAGADSFMQFRVDGTERVRITSAGRLGIGDNSPDTMLHVKGIDNVLGLFESTDADALIEFKDNSTSDTILMGAVGGNDLVLRCDAGNIKFHVSNNNERLRIDNDGKLILGTEFVNAGNANANISLFISGSRTGAYGGETTNAIIFDNQTAAVDAGGTLTLAGYSGTQAIAKALIRGGNEGSSSTQAGYFSVFTRPASGILSEKFRIDSAGNVGLGTNVVSDSTGNARAFTIARSDANGQVRLILKNQATGFGNGAGYHQGIDGANVFIENRTNGGYIDFATFDSGGSYGSRLRITSGGDVGINGGSDVERKVDIVTSNGNSVLIRPNTGGDNSQGNANVVNNSLIFRMPYGQNAGSSSNAGARIGIVFTGRNDGSGYVDNPSKSASIYGISEDDSAGYTRKMGMGFFTSPFDASQTEKMRISNEGYVTTPLQPAFAARLGSNIDITSNTFTDIVFSVQEFDNSGSYNTSNGRFTVPVAGKYYFGVQIYAGFNGTGVRVMHANFRVNGTSVAQTDMFGGASNHGGTHYHPTAVGHAFLSLNKNDYVTWNTGGFSHTGGQAILYASTGNRFFGYLVG